MQIDNQNIQLTVSETCSEVVIRHGQAAPVVVPQQYCFDGNIEAPANYYNSRNNATQNSHFTPDKAVLHVSVKDGLIVLRQNPNDPKEDIVRGRIFIAHDIESWGFNSERKWRSSELADFLRRNRRFFSDTQKHADLLAELKAMKVTTTGQIETSDDRRGSKTTIFAQSAQSNVPVDFEIEIPIIEGYRPIKVKVEIFIDISGQSVSLIIDSTDVTELIITEKERLIKEQIQNFAATGIPILLQ